MTMLLYVAVNKRVALPIGSVSKFVLPTDRYKLSRYYLTRDKVSGDRYIYPRQSV